MLAFCRSCFKITHTTKPRALTELYVMNVNLALDLDEIADLLNLTLEETTDFLQRLNERSVGKFPQTYEMTALSEEGIGAKGALETFKAKYASGITASSGSRYFGFVTGGTTPAALAGDWLTSAFDQNVIGTQDSCAPYIERETIAWLRQLFKLSDSHQGAFVSGATMANFVGLALARQWVAKQVGIDVAREGLYSLPPITVFSGAPHSCIFKALSMLGMGRNSLQLIPTLPDREAIALEELKKALKANRDRPCIVVANAGTVNTADFDDLSAIAALKDEFNFWLHVDAAFGGFAACSPQYFHLVAGLDAADSIAIDAHKWLNVPYDSAMQFTKHRDLQLQVFQNRAAYLGEISENPEFVHLTPENSRRLRALPAWFTLKAYGAKGYCEIIERNCYLARLLGEKIDKSPYFKLLTPVRLNVVCFTLAIARSEILLEIVEKFLTYVRDRGQVFLTPTVYRGIPAMRAALSNWRTTDIDIDIAWETLTEAIDKLKNTGDERSIYAN
jgi:glutamate/tyrosine decarboxylase-like PLP-dependent enzyme